MKIAFFDGLEQQHREYVERELYGNEIEVYEEPIQKAIVSKRDDIAIVSGFISSQLSKDVLDLLPRVRCIATRSTGYDHIDLEETNKRGIVVQNVPNYGENTVAEHTFALILAVTRKIPCAVKRVESGQFSFEGLRGIDLKDKTIGIVGGGHIGVHVAQIAHGFGMKVLVYDAYPNPDLADAYHFTYINELPALLEKSDIVTLHAPLNEHTYHILNAEMFSYFKEGSYLINTARGALVDTKALLQALKANRLAGAGLDVLESEQFLDNEMLFLAEEHTEEDMRKILQDHVLLGMDNVVVTPHIAFNTEEAHMRIIQTTVGNIQTFIAGDASHAVSG